jgi:DNA invertase Pin-like site-specific DNA recombinase
MLSWIDNRESQTITLKRQRKIQKKKKKKKKKGNFVSGTVGK